MSIVDPHASYAWTWLRGWFVGDLSCLCCRGAAEMQTRAVYTGPVYPHVHQMLLCFTRWYRFLSIGAYIIVEVVLRGCVLLWIV
jgi:hypothetical protein